MHIDGFAAINSTTAGSHKLQNDISGIVSFHPEVIGVLFSIYRHAEIPGV